MNHGEFRQPSAQYRGVTLWMLNDKLELDEILAQMEGFRDAGWGALIGRTFNGLLTEYLGDQWMEMVDAIVERAGELGLRVWLQAGYMPSGMPGLTPDTTHKGLLRQSLAEPVADGDQVLQSDGQYRYCVRLSPHVLDLLNKQAVTDYLNKAYRDPWHSRFGDQFGKTIEAIWVDEPHFRPPLLPWSDGASKKFRDQWGYDLADRVASLFAQVGDWQKVRHHYWRTVLAMFLEGYFAPVGEWCREHGIKFSGHLMGEDTLNSQIAWTGATMPCYEHM